MSTPHLPSHRKLSAPSHEENAQKQLIYTRYIYVRRFKNRRTPIKSGKQHYSSHFNFLRVTPLPLYPHMALAMFHSLKEKKLVCKCSFTMSHMHKETNQCITIAQECLHYLHCTELQSPCSYTSKRVPWCIPLFPTAWALIQDRLRYSETKTHTHAPFSVHEHV